ncbi:hypothetical protein GCM10010265_34770 [Streptomyces griseoincarnatus]|nr:hypothetical protein GCM10010265_34770 [Streptomyces griseoincarnatus]
MPPGSAGPKPAHRTQARTEAAHHARARLERRPLCRPAARGRSPPTGHRPARRRPTTPAPAWNGDPCAARQRGAEARPPDTGPHGSSTGQNRAHPEHDPPWAARQGGRSPPTGHRPARRRPTAPAPAWNTSIPRSPDRAEPGQPTRQAPARTKAAPNGTVST